MNHYLWNGVSRSQLFWVVRSDELFLRVLPVFPAWNPIISPDTRLWKRSERMKKMNGEKGENIMLKEMNEKDTVFVTGSILFIFLKTLQDFLNEQFSDSSHHENDPYDVYDLFNSPCPSTHSHLLRLQPQVTSWECDFTHTTLAGMAAIARGMMTPIERMRPSLQQVTTLMNSLFPPELAIDWKTVASEPITANDIGRKHNVSKVVTCMNSSTLPFITQSFRHPCDTLSEWSLLETNQIEAYLLTIVPFLSPCPTGNPAVSSIRLAHLTGMAVSILQYDRYLHSKQNVERQYEETSNPLLQMDMEEIMKTSMTLSEVQELMGVLKSLNEREQERQQSLLRIELVMLVAIQFIRILSSEETVHSHLLQVAGLTTTLELYPELIPCLWSFYSESIVLIFSHYYHVDILSELAHLLFNYLPRINTSELFHQFTTSTKYMDVLRMNELLLRDVIHHPLCSPSVLCHIVHNVRGHGMDMTVFAPVIVNHIQSIQMQMQLEGKQVFQDMDGIMQLLFIPELSNCSLMSTPVVFQSVLNLVKMITTKSTSISFTMKILSLARNYFNQQQQWHPEHITILQEIVFDK